MVLYLSRLGLWPSGSAVLNTNVCSRLFVTLGFVLLHFIQRVARERA